VGLSAERANSRISAVTVYRDRAVITRTASAQLAAGEQVLSFENLPAALVDQSLQASGRGIAGATILDVSAQNVFTEATSNDRVKELETQIKELQRQRRVLDDRGKVLEEQRGFVQRMLQASTTNGPAGPTGAAARPSLDEWQKLFAYSEETLGDQCRAAEARFGSRAIAGEADCARTATESVEGSARQAVEDDFDTSEPDDGGEAGCSAAVRGTRGELDSVL